MDREEGADLRDILGSTNCTFWWFCMPFGGDSEGDGGF